MNTIFKKSIIWICLLNLSFIIAQDLERKVPANSQAVVSINGGQVLNLFSIAQFDNSVFGKEIVKELQREVDDFNGIEDFGVDLNSKGYFFYQPQDSVSFFSFLLPLKDPTRFVSLFNQENSFKEREVWGEANIFMDRDVVMIQDNNSVLFSIADVPYGYFDGQMEALQLKYPDLEPYAIRRQEIKKWMLAKAKENYKPARSIVSNRSYLENKDAKAEASVWVNNYGSLMNSYYQGTMGYMMGMGNDFMQMPNFNKYGFGTLSAHLNFNQDNVSINSSIELKDNMLKSLKKVYKSKMNKSFFKYANLDNALAYMTFSMNTEAMMDEYPNMITQLYGSMMPNYEEEMNFAAELVSTMLDEKAIGELMTGNVLFVLDGLSEKEVEYVTYEYDDEYNEKQVTKKKIELLPDFTMIFGTKRKDLAAKLAILGKKHELLSGGNNRYKSTPNSEIPFDLFLGIDDDAVVISTTANGLIRKDHKTSSTVRKAVSKNIMVWNVDFQKIMNVISKEDLGLDDKTSDLINQNLKSATLVSAKLKGNKMHTSFALNAPSADANTLEMFMEFIEQMMK